VDSSSSGFRLRTGRVKRRIFKHLVKEEMPVYAYSVIWVGLIVWFYPFIPAHQKTPAASVVDRRSRWGMLLQFLAFVLLWQGRFWMRPAAPWRVLICVLLFGAAAALSWSSARALAGQLRIDAALGAEHHLVKSGPYRLVRNPIYLSMLLVMCATAVLVATGALFFLGLALFVVGTQIRVRTEEKLLAAYFGEEFLEYKRSTPAYLPFL
jgi:protein-S-isoprenylcysteine O-methyltransferase Ste14